MSTETERLVIELAPTVRMPFRLIPAGEFRMGQRCELGDEEPVHRVRIPEPFWMAQTPVTQEQFAAWTQAAHMEHENEFKERATNPAENMDWHQARAFCRWLTDNLRAQFPEGFRLATLPTEAQWEYACRARTETEYHTGDGEAALVEAGWFGEEWDSGSTHPVAMKAPNAFDLHDMHGNVWEWCADVWDANAYRKRVDGWVAREWNLSDAGQDAERDSEKNPQRVLRGGSWDYSASNCRSAIRNLNWAGIGSRCFGFRPVLVPGLVVQPERGAPGKGTAEPATGDRGRGTSPESEGAGGAFDLAQEEIHPA